MFSFIETKLFTRLVDEFLSDEELASLQQALAANPEAGALIPGSGGVRKLRWGVRGRGKRGGVRVIYYVKRRDGVIWLLTIYSKSEIENIPAQTLRSIKEQIDAEEQTKHRT
jgi:hypothetical protein